MREDGRGRPWRDLRDVLNGILWVMRTGAPWKDLPDRYPPYPTCHRRFQSWATSGTLEQVLWALAEDLKAGWRIDVRSASLSTFAPAKKGAMPWVRQSAGKGPRSWQLQTASGLPIALCIASAVSA